MAVGLIEEFQSLNANWYWEVPEGFYHRFSSDKIEIGGLTGHTGTHPLTAQGVVRSFDNQNVVVRITVDCYSSSRGTSAATVNVLSGGVNVLQISGFSRLDKQGSTNFHDMQEIAIGGAAEVEFSLASGDRGNIADVKIEIVGMDTPVFEPAPAPSEPAPAPAPVPVTNHVIALQFGTDVGQFRQIVAAAQDQIKQIVELKLGSSFELSAINVQGQFIELMITEFGGNLIPAVVVAAIVAAVLVVLAVAGGFFIGYLYYENQILKDHVEAQSGTLDQIAGIVNDPSKSDAEKVDLVGDVLSSQPKLPAPDGGFDLPDFGLGVGTGAGAAVAIGIVVLIVALSRR